MLLPGKAPRSAIALLASSVAVLLIAGTAAAHEVATTQPTGAVTVEAVAAPASADAPAAVTAHDSGEPAPATPGVPTPSPPTTGAAAAPAATSPPSTRAEPPSPGPTFTAAAPTTRVTPPPTFVVPPAPPTPQPVPPLETVEIGPGAWTSTFEGITATLHMTPVAPRAGETVHFSIDTTYTGEGCCIVFLYPGDGALYPPANNSMDCAHAPSSLHQELSHTYAQSGTVVVHVQPSVIPCRITPGALPDPVNSHLFTTISVAPGS